MLSETDFSILLSNLVEKSNFTKNELVRACQIDRSSFFQFLNAKRTPTEKQYYEITSSLKLSKGEKEELDNEYRRVVLGERIWRKRESVKKCLDTMADSERMRSYHFPPVKTDELTTDRTEHFEGAMNVEQLLQHFLANEFLKDEPSLEIFMPYQNTPFFEYLKNYLYENKEKKMMIRQLMQFTSEKDIQSNNVLADFYNVLTAFTCVRENYEAYYYYASSKLTHTIGVFYPYYVIGGERAALVSADFNSAIFTSDQGFVEACKQSFDDALRQSEKVSHKYRSIWDISQAYEEILKKDSRWFYYADMPCASTVANAELIEHCTDEKLHQSIKKHCRIIQSKKKPVEFITVQGLRNFAEKGFTNELASAGITDIAKGDRKNVLNLIKTRMNNTVFIIDEEMMPDLGSWALTVVEGEQILLHKQQKDMFFEIRIGEKNAVDAFVDYLDSLTTTTLMHEPAVYPLETAEKFVMQLLCELDNPDID